VAKIDGPTELRALRAAVEKASGPVTPAEMFVNANMESYATSAFTPPHAIAELECFVRYFAEQVEEHLRFEQRYGRVLAAAGTVGCQSAQAGVATDGGRRDLPGEETEVSDGRV
jgi:hypothetical protein